MKDVLPPNPTGVSVHDIHRLKEQGASSLMYSFALTYVSGGLKQRKDCVLRIFNEDHHDKALKEFTVLKALKEWNYPVPTVYHFEAEDEIIGRPLMIMEKIGARSASYYLSEEVTAKGIVDKMAKTLLKLHKIDLKCIQNSDLLEKQHAIRQRRLLELRFFIRNRCKTFLGLVPFRQRRFIVAVKRLDEVKPKKFRPAILHMDYMPDHVLVSNRGLIIVDWDEATVGDPAYDVAWAYHNLRLGREIFKVDLGECFVKSYENYLGQTLVNLQFCKDMAALELALWFGLSPFHADSKFLDYGRIIDLTFGYMFGRFSAARYVNRLQKRMTEHHTKLSNIEYLQNYAIHYLERDGKGLTNRS